MRIMTFNIQHALDYKNQKIDIDLFADSIKKYGADICGLNEVRGKGFLKGYTDQTNAIADRLDFYRYFGEAIKVKGTSPYGNALVSKYPIKSAETVRIPDPKVKNAYEHYESRCVIKAVLDIEGSELCVLICHMGLAKDERKNAVETLCGLIDKIEMPLVVMGDFNTVPEDAVLAPLFDRMKDTADISDAAKGPTFPSYNPDIKIDYLLYRGLVCENAVIVEEIVSDHFSIFADFKFE